MTGPRPWDEPEPGQDAGNWTARPAASADRGASGPTATGWSGGPATGSHEAYPNTGEWHGGPASGPAAPVPPGPLTGGHQAYADDGQWQGWQDSTGATQVRAPAGTPYPSPPLTDDGYGYGYDDGYEYAPDLAEEAEPRPARRRGPADLDDAPRLPRVPGFDGLRALALLAVLAFHQGLDVARGGFLGVSSFFTLSGFLVATLALAEWAQTGRLAVGRFWERRARRIVPGVLALLALVVALQVVLRVGSSPRFRTDVLWSSFYGTNWRAVIAGEDIAGIFIDPSPVQHLWAVAIELQLMVVVPLLFVVLMTLARQHWRATGVLFAAAAVASFAVARATALSDGNGGLAYFGTHTRAGELLVGVALAYAVLTPSVRSLIETDAGRAAVRYGGPAALAVLAWLWHTTSLGDPNLFAGITALNAVLTAWVVLAATTPGPTSAVLGAWPLQTLGRFSFAAYLLHWPIYLLISPPRVELDGNLLFVPRVVATLVAAVGATYAVERPFRERMRMPRPRLTALLGGTTVVLVAAVLVLPVQPPPNVSLTIDDGNGPGDLDAVVPASGEPVATIALVGDSLAASLTPGLDAWNTEFTDQQIRVNTHVTENCPTSAPGPVRLAGETIGEQTACVGWEPRLPRLLDRAEADVIVVVTGIDDLGEREIDREWRHLGDPLYDEWLAGQLDTLAETLAREQVPVLWATVPHVRMPGADGDWTRVDDNDPRRVDRFNELIRSAVSGHDGFEVIDLMAAMQDRPGGGEFSADDRQDGRTLTESGAGHVANWLVPQVLETVEGGGA